MSNATGRNAGVGAGSVVRALYGCDEPPSPSLALRAGPLDLTYRAGKLLDIRLGDVDIWHGVTFPFRDANWGTPEPELAPTICEIGDQAFRLRAEGKFPTEPPIALRLDFIGAADGVVEVVGEARTSGPIATNRLGICLLHPMSVAGQPIEVTHDDGRLSRSTFPTLVPPWPPFMQVRAIRHAYAPGRWARCDFAGDVFELEDQRNNADASFKTYSRSNMAQRPYRLAAGACIRQSVRLSVEGAPRRPRVASATSPITVAPGDSLRGPLVGLEITHGDLEQTPQLRAALDALQPDFLHLSVAEDDASAVDAAGLAAIAACGTQLRLDLAATNETLQTAQFAAVRDALGAVGLKPSHIAVFPCEEQSVSLARACFPEARIGGGTPHYFAQLNRLERMGAVDFVTFTSSPLVHGADDELVMQSLASLPLLVETAKARYPGLPVRLGPIGIGVRKSPLGAQPHSDGSRRLAMARRDPRARGLYGAAWTLSCLSHLALANVEAVTLQSLIGDAGLIDVSTAGHFLRHPAYFMRLRIAGANSFRSARVSDSRQLAALELDHAGRRETLLANLTARTIEIEFADVAPGSNVSIMDAASWDAFTAADDGWAEMRHPLASHRVSLAPYAIASLVEGDQP